MSKIKVGDKVIVKQNGMEGVVKSRDIILHDDGTCTIEYIVKLGDGFAKWDCFTRKQLKRNNKPAPKKAKKKPFYTVIDSWDGYKVVVVGELRTYNQYYEFSRLCVGYAICSPFDIFDLNVGIKIASRRCRKQPFANFMSLNRRDFTEETINAIIKTKAEYIANNIIDFTPLEL